MKNDNTNKKNEKRAAIVPTETLKAKVIRNGICSMKRKVLTKGILRGIELSEECDIPYAVIDKLMKGIAHCLRAGYEVRLGGDDGVRFFPCLSTDLDEMFVCAETMGEFRNALKDVQFKIMYNGETLSADEVRERQEEVNEHRETRRNMICVTPDQMVTCPKCGANFRVGKVLADVK